MIVVSGVYFQQTRLIENCLQFVNLAEIEITFSKKKTNLNQGGHENK
jgi:hypothetical protein